MEQNQLFIESLSDAIEEATNQLGGTKKVGSMLWPEKTIREAGNHLSNCINPEHSQKLSLEQIDFILSNAREKGVHAVPYYIGARYGYKFIPVEPEDEKAELQREFIKASQVIEKISNRLNELS